MINKVQEVSFAANLITLDMSGWSSAVVQFVAPSGTISITATNDGATAATATNFTAVQATKLADGTAVTAVATAGLYRIANVGRFVQLGGALAAATKVLVHYSK